MTRKDAFFAAALAVVTAFLVGCGGGGGSSERASTLSQAPQPATAAPSTTVPAANQVGQPFTNLGITATVTSAETAESIALNESNSRPGSGYETYTDTPAGPGAKYEVIKTHIVNNAKTSLDLTCSLPIKTLLIDDQGRQFDPIQNLYKVQGNPECNTQLQPGFDSDMTWPYRVPAATHVVSWEFTDTTDFSTIGSNAPTTIRLQIPGA
jgi:hypothetical protein